MAYIKKINAKGVDYDLEAQALTGLTSSITELNYVQGATSNIQTQITNTSSVATTASTNITNHAADTDIHVTATDKTNWNAKQGAITANGILKADGAGNITATSNLTDTAYQTPQTTLSGYGITDAKIESGVITLGSNTVTPLTAESTLDPTKVSAGALANGMTATTQEASDNTTKLATTAYVTTAVNNVLEASKAMTYEGTVGTGGTVTDLPAIHTVGDTYVVCSNGTFAGVACKIGDMIICQVSGIVANDADWNVVHCGDASGKIAKVGDIVVDRIATFADTNGNVKDSGFTIAKSVPSDALFTDTVYTHPAGSAPSQASGLYKFATDSTSHISSVTAVTKADITALGIPETDTNTTYSIAGGANQVTLTPSSGSASTVDLTSKSWGNYTFTTAGWTTSGDWKVQTLTVTGMTASDYPTLIPTYASTSAVSDMQAALSKIAYIDTAAGSITAYATEAPTTAITFELVGR